MNLIGTLFDSIAGVAREAVAITGAVLTGDREKLKGHKTQAIAAATIGLGIASACGVAIPMWVYLLAAGAGLGTLRAGVTRVAEGVRIATGQQAATVNRAMHVTHEAAVASAVAVAGKVARAAVDDAAADVLRQVNAAGAANAAPDDATDEQG